MAARKKIQPNESTLAEFQKNGKERASSIVRSGVPHVLTVNGKPTLVVQDVHSYQRLLDAIERAETIAGVKRSLKEFDQGLGLPAREALERAMPRRAPSSRKRRPDKAA